MIFGLLNFSFNVRHTLNTRPYETQGDSYIILKN